jgi:hypothetical protein
MMRLREKTLKFHKGSASFFSPPSGTTSQSGQFGMDVEGFPYGPLSLSRRLLLSAKEARALAAELMRRADDVETAVREWKSTC